jgi:hypothetical protein
MATDSVRKLFPQVLRNGYSPIPNRDKHCYLKHWPTIEVDEDQCRAWTRQTRWPAIGLRVEAPLLVLDFDLPDEGIMKAVRDTLPRFILDEALERRGSPPKTAFFLQLDNRDELFHKLGTRRYHFQGSPKPAFAVEVFGGGGGAKQFGAFGPHSHDEETGAVLLEYEWTNGWSPATVPLADLPVMRRAEVVELIDTVWTPLLKGWPGLVLDEMSVVGGDDFEKDYDLTDDMTFVDGEGNEYTLEELEQEAKAKKELKEIFRVTGSFTKDPASSGSARCKVNWSKIRGVSITDFKTGVTHRRRVVVDDPRINALIGKHFGEE